MRLLERGRGQRLRSLQPEPLDRGAHEARADNVRTEGAFGGPDTAAATGRRMAPEVGERLRHRLTRIRMLAVALLKALRAAEPVDLMVILDELAEQRERLRAELVVVAKLGDGEPRH